MRYLIIPTLLALLTAACARESPGPSPAVQQAIGSALAVATPEELNYHPDLQVEIAAMRRLPTGVLVQDLVPGEGDSVVAGTTVAVRYSGWLPDGTQFDGNADRDPIRFRIGVGMVIPGWDDGLIGMKVGGKRKLVIPPDQGYGSEGSGPIPPNATLVFDVEVVEIVKQS
jgi:peptidylprolyl isomerase